MLFVRPLRHFIEISKKENVFICAQKLKYLRCHNRRKTRTSQPRRKKKNRTMMLNVELFPEVYKKPSK